MAKIKMLYKILLLHVLYGSILASNCGQSTIPFSFEALPDGQPVLGCARPTCFGWNPDGSIASKPATFYRINKKPDGYFRQSANIKPRAINVEEAPNFHPQTAECAATFESDHCPNENQWIGGIGPQINVSKQPFSVQCCSYKSLELSEDRGVATVNPGQIVIGGEILKEGGDRQYAFDYISDIIKHNSADGTVSYEVSIRRLPCLPYPSEFSVPIENTVPAEIIERFTKAEEKLKKNDLSKAFQASLLAENGIEGEAAVAAGQPQADVIEGPFVAEGETIQQVNSVDGYGVGAPGGYNLAPPSYQGAPPNYQGAPPQGGYAGAPPQGGYAGAPPQGGYAGGYGGGGGGGGSCSSNAGCSCVGSGCRCGNSGCGCSGGGCNCNGNGCGSQLLSYGGAPQGGCGGSSCGGSGFYCFSGDTIVETSTGPKRMDELKLNDWVLSANGSEVLFTRIESWIHRLPSKKAEFLQLELEDGRTLKITSKHFIYKTECTAPGQTVLFHELTKQAVFAEKVQVGDCLYVLPDKNAKNFIQQRVKSIETVVEYGIYAPMTGNTDIVVNDIYASCYNIIYNKEMQRSFFRSIKRMPSLKSLLGFHEDESESEKFPAREYSQAKEKWLGIKCMILPTLERELGKRISGKRVLDVGCGNGTYVENFLKWGALHIIGIDPNENMIELCKSKFQGHLKFEFHVHSAMDMAYNEEFDFATSLFVLQFMKNFDELEKTLVNIQKALKPGGEFFAFVPHGRPDIHFTDEAGKKFGAYFKPASHPPPDGSRAKIIFYDNQEIIGDVDATFFYVETYERLLKKAGFSKIEWIEPYIDPKFIEKYGEEFFQCLKDPPRDLILYAVKS